MKSITINNKTFLVDGTNIGWWTCAQDGIWEPYIYKIIDKLVDNNSVCIDLGAWIGLVTLYLAQTAKEVYCIEPDEIAFTQLSESIGVTEKKNIIAHRLAISNFDGILELGNDLHLGDSMTRINQSKNLFEIPCNKISTFCINNNIIKVDFIKIDIEGSEEFLFEDFEFFEKHRPNIFLQTHYGWMKNDIKFKNLLFELSKLYKFVYDENLNLIDKTNFSNYTNLVFTDKIL